MKRQQLDKLIGKKITGGYGPGGKGRGQGQGGRQPPKNAQGEAQRVPIAVKLIKGLGEK